MNLDNNNMFRIDIWCAHDVSMITKYYVVSTKWLLFMFECVCQEYVYSPLTILYKRIVVTISMDFLSRNFDLEENIFFFLNCKMASLEVVLDLDTKDGFYFNLLNVSWTRTPPLTPITIFHNLYGIFK